MDKIPWDIPCNAAAHAFARTAAELKKTFPCDYQGTALDHLINDLMTELWDFGFTQTEIRNAMQRAVADMPRYAKGYESRADASKEER